MPHFLSHEELQRTAPAETAFASPVPTQIVSNGEYNPLPQTREQAKVEARIKDLADRLAPGHGMDRRRFLASTAGMAAAFLAMNEVFGPLFDVSRAEAQTPGVADQRAGALAGQFILDDQTHFVRDDFNQTGLLDLAKYARQNWNPALVGENNLARFKFENYVKEIYVDSDTKVALLSGAPFDDPTWDLLTNDQIAAARAAINRISGSRRLLGHAVITPNKGPWMAEVDRCIAQVRPDSWKGYTVGDPLSASKWPWRMDDEKVAYQGYERMMKHGIRTVCVHKGLVPPDYERTFPNWQYARADDVGKAARDWPGLTFVIYHSALKPFLTSPEESLAEFERTGRIDWVSDLAEVPAKYGVTNVYAELGTSFASSVVTHPRHCAAMLGILVKGFGADHVLWGTDSVWYGSPQWQIEAFRRIEISDDLRRAHGFAPLGAADGPVKRAILGENAARLYGLDLRTAFAPEALEQDGIARVRREYEAAGPERSNLAYGLVRARV
jgi:predicted TIM-barrel fold metal-dependent hydrolase